jgi:hypothetical protein
VLEDILTIPGSNNDAKRDIIDIYSGSGDRMNNGTIIKKTVKVTL